MMLRIVSFSELDTAKQCPFKHQLSYVERWSKPQEVMSALSKGTMWHRLMEAHYHVLRRGRGDKESKLLVDSRIAVQRELDGQPDDLAALMWWMYAGYINQYGTDPAWKILAVEHPAQVRLPTGRVVGEKDGKKVYGRSSFVLKMKIDLVVQEIRTGNVKVVDHKSGKDLPGDKQLQYDDQFGLYVWGMRQLGRRVFGCEYNAARTLRLQEDIKLPGKTPLDQRFRRIPLYRTDRELDQIAIDAYLQAKARYSQQREADRAGIDSPRHPDTERCGWRCDFNEPCLAGRKGLDTRQFLRDKGFIQDFSRH